MKAIFSWPLLVPPVVRNTFGKYLNCKQEYRYEVTGGKLGLTIIRQTSEKLGYQYTETSLRYEVNMPVKIKGNISITLVDRLLTNILPKSEM
jgi:hypothetical protein